MNRLLLAVAISCIAWGQAAPSFGSFLPDRGFMPYGSYALSETEAIDEYGGGLTLRFPMATLAPGRGGFRHGIALTYNSQIYELKTDVASVSNVLECGGGGQDCPSRINALTQETGKGGWQYSFDYRFEVEYRPGMENSACTIGADQTWALIKYTLFLPDGSSHLLRLVGSSDYFGDGYYRHSVDGGKVCPNQPGNALTYPLRFYTTDGTFIQVSKDASGWKATMPDGSTAAGPIYRANKMCDRNGNCVTVENGFDDVETTKPVTRLVDDFGRLVRIKYNTTYACPDPPNCYTSSDEIYQAAYGGNATIPAGSSPLAWLVVWGGSPVGTLADPAAYSCLSPSNVGSFNCKTVTSVRNVMEIVLPENGGALKYSFLYADNDAPAGKKGWGELREARMPNAAANVGDYRPRVEYTWQYRPEVGGLWRNAQFDSRNRLTSKTVQRTETAEGVATGQTESWTISYPASPDNAIETTAPDGGVTKNYFHSSPGMDGLLWKTENPDGSVVEKYWKINEPWIGVTANADRKNAYVRAEMRKPGGGTYSAGAFTYDKNGNVKSRTDLDYGVSIPRDAQQRPNGVPTGTALRTTEFDYHYETQAADATPTVNAGNAYWTEFGLAHKRAPRRTTVKNASGLAESAVEFVYDNAATTANVTAEAKWDNTRTGGATLPALGLLSRAGNNAAVTDFTWDRGNPKTQTSPANDVAVLTYDAIAGCTGTETNLYPTWMVAHSGQGSMEERQDFQYDCATGLLKERQREPGQGAKAAVTRGSYDRFGRSRGESDYTGSGGGNLLRQTQTSYDDAQRWVRVAGSLEGASDLRTSAVYSFNAMGGLERTRTNDDTGGAVTASSTGGVVSERAMRYFNGGRYEIESKGWRPVAAAGVVEPPRAWVRRTLDRAGRLLAVETFAGAVKPAPWGGNGSGVSSVTYSYAGNVVTETDAAGRTREETRDGLGRLTTAKQANENPTAYTYNARDLLVSVAQTDTSNYGAAKIQARIFDYDSLGRLKTATNPESGTQTYEYEPDGLLKKKTDGRSVWVSLTYDGARRLIGRTYSDGTPEVKYCYDGAVYASGACVALAGRAGDASDYPKGRPTGNGNAHGRTNALRVDALGRAVKVEQGVGGFVQAMEYVYGAGGALQRVTYPNGRQVDYKLTDRGRIHEVEGLNGGATLKYLSAAKYGANGEMTEAKMGNLVVTEKKLYDALGRMTETEVTRGTLVGRFGFGYAPNGNVTGHTITTPTRAFTQYYGYDNVNRLRMAWEGPGGYDPASATCASIQASWPVGQWCLWMGYDGFANAWGTERRNATGVAATGPAWYLLSSGAVNNRMKDVAYDNAGNQTQYLPGNAQRTAEYDAEGRIKRVLDGASVLAEYFYDGEGRRVKRVTAGVSTYYLYDAAGQTLAEYQSGGSWTATAGAAYWFQDHLGSTRLRMKADGTEVSRIDYEPWGAEIARTGEGYGVGDAAKRFTGKERDGETGLDYFGARYFSAGLGRFTSPDLPLIDQDPADPQSWNLFSYVRNNPMIFTDPTGRCKKGDDGKHHDSDEGPCVAPGGTNVTVTEKAPKVRDQAAEVQAEMTRLQYEAWKRNQDRNKPKEDEPLGDDAKKTLKLAYERTAHDLGCVGLGGLITGGAGVASAPIIPKAFSGGGTTVTSPASTLLGGIKVGTSVRTPVGMPGTSSFVWRRSGDAGRIFGRYLPYAGLIAGAVATGACLSSNP